MQLQVSQKCVGLVGARGYSGLRLAHALANHPDFKLTVCFTSEASSNWKLSDEIATPWAKQVQSQPASALENPKSLEIDALFLATPTHTSMQIANQVFGKKNAKGNSIKIVDLSGAFRLPLETFEKSYKEAHTASALLPQAHFGLSPWAKPSRSELISNPGCYATSILMALIPLLRDGLIDPGSIVVNSKSGTTGAGRKAAENLLLSEVADDCIPYKVGNHQHAPEILKALKEYAGVELKHLPFTTELLPIRQGILSTITAKTTTTLAAIQQSFENAYAGYPLVLHGALPEFKHLSLKKVVNTPMTHIGYQITGNTLYLFSMIDNLSKGAATQAIENLNRAFDFQPQHGLQG